MDSVQQIKNTKYNIIIEFNLMDDLGIDLNFSDNSIAIKNDGYLTNGGEKTRRIIKFNYT